MIAAGCTDQVTGEFGSESTTGPVAGGSSDAAESGPELDSGAAADSETSAASSGGGASTDTGGVPTAEVCDAIDNDLDGLVDEFGPDNESCDGCQLLQGVGQAWWACDVQKDWETARYACELYGATLALVQDPEAQAFVQQAIGEGWFWIGARQAPDEGAWSWLDGSPLDYANWAGAQPDNSAPSQDCVRLTFGIIDGGDWFDGAWDDFQCDQPAQMLCSAPHGS